MVQKLGNNRRLLIALIIIILVLGQVAIGGYLYHLLCPSTPQQAVVQSGRIQSQRPSTPDATSGDPRPTAVWFPGTDEEGGTYDGPILREVGRVLGPLIPATDVTALARAFDEEQALEHIAYLASDELNGRQPGSPGGRAAGDYVAEHFAAYGLEPAGIDGTYYQTFTVPYGRIDRLPVLDVIPPRGETLGVAYDYATDYRALTGGYLGAGEGEGPVVWLNKCLHDDYDGLDMVAKIVLCRYASDPAVYREAIEHRVGGLLLLDRGHQDDSFRRGGYRETAWVPETIPAYLISEAVARDLLIGTDYTLDDLSLRFSATPLSTTVRMAVTTEEQDQVAARNVLGLLPGADPTHDDKVVIIGAHYDHLGPEPDGAIMNGANDNASGVATLLEIARLWQAESFRPALSVLFAAWDGEELGLLGSRHYVEHPTQSITRTVSMLNLDMVGAGETLQIDGEGPVAAQLEAGAETYGVTYTSTFHGRSDHVPFYGAGVPAAMLIWWPDDFYHTVDDEMDIIRPSKLKAVGVLSAHTMAALAQGQVELEHAVDRLQASVAARDREAFVAMLDPADPDQKAGQTAWFDSVWSRGLADFSIQPDQIRVGDREARVKLKVAYHWADGERREPSVSYPARFTERDGTWRFAGPDLDELVGEVVTVARFAGTSVDARALLSTTQQAYVSLVADVGAEPITGTRFITYPDEDALRAIARPAAHEDIAWLVPSAGLAQIAGGEPITPALVSLVLNQMGLPPDQADWLREGLVAHYEDGAAALYLHTLVTADPPSSLFSPGGSQTHRTGAAAATEEEQAGVLRAHAWSAADYLLERYGTEGLRALCAAWGRDGPVIAFEEALGLSAEEFEAAWRAARIQPLRTVAAGIETTIADRERAVLENDEARFLSTVTSSDSVLRAEQRHWFAALSDRSARTPVLSHTVSAELVGWMPQGDEARVALRTTTVFSGGQSSQVSCRALFVRELGRWRYAGVDWDQYASEHFLLKVQRHDRAWAEYLLAQAEEAYGQVTGDLRAALPLPLQIKVYEDREQLRESIASLLPEGADSWTAEGQSIKLWLDQGSQPVLTDTQNPHILEALARGMTHQVLSAQGVDAAWIREGVAAFEADRLRPLGTHWGSAAWQKIVRDAIGSRRILDWGELVSFDHLSSHDLEVARAQSWSLIATIVGDYGLDGLGRFIAEAARPHDMASDLRNALGVDPEAFLAKWRRDAQNLRRTHGAPDELVALARRFDSDRALGDVAALASPEFGGRQAGSPGADKAAAYIAEQFSTLGLQPLGDRPTLSDTLRLPLRHTEPPPSGTLTLTGTRSYLQQFPISYTHLITIPTLALLDTKGGESHQFTYRRDFIEVAGRGTVEGQLVWVSVTDLEGLRFDGALVIERDVSNPAQRASELQRHGAAGLIILTDREPEALRTTIGFALSQSKDYESGDQAADTIPVFELIQNAFEPLMEQLQVTAADLATAPPALPLDARVRMELPRTSLTTAHTANVLGLLPGSDPRLAHEVLLIGAHYDHVGQLPGGVYFPGANQNASGVAAMLEMARVWQRGGYQPARRVLFAAWGAEETDSAGADHYVSGPIVPLTSTVAVISLDSIADGGGYRLLIHGDSGGDLPLTNRFEVSASRLDRRAWRRGATSEGWHALIGSQAIPTVKLTWAESEDLAYQLTDTVDAIDPERLANSGEILTLAVAWLAGQ
jgi:Zn-dependent M28 family amino/carboxypeptidase